MKKARALIALTLAAAIALTLAACAASTFDFDEEAAVERAKQVADTANKRDYDAVCNLLRQGLLGLITAEELQAAWDPMISPAGAFVEYESEQALGQTDKSGENYIVVVLSCKYENSSLIYTVVLDTDMEITGMYLK